jgi:hypothetical protein
MALKTTIVTGSPPHLSTPDKTETKVDVTVGHRGYWKRTGEGEWTLVPVGQKRRVETHTIKTWFACTLAACEAAATAYVTAGGTGSYAWEETNEIIHSYTFSIIETTITIALLPPPSVT